MYIYAHKLGYITLSRSVLECKYRPVVRALKE